MLRVTLAQARPGMKLALPLHHPRHHDVVLLRAGVMLDSYSVPRLAELFVPEVWIAHPGTEDLVRFVDPRILASYRELTTTVGMAIDTAMVQSTVQLEFGDYKRAVMSVLARLMENPQAALMVSDLVGGDRPFVRHCGNVSVLSLLMGLKLEFYLVRERPKLSPTLARDLSGLGVGAMLHDIGMTRLDPDTLARWNATRDETDEPWREHVRLGFEMVKGELDPSAAAVVLHHHQRFDGSGFPCRGEGEAQVCLKGSNIHIFARIAACADLYDRLRHPASAPGASDQATPPIPAVRALRLMRQAPYTHWIDPVVFLALLAVAPPYPPGTLVTLSDGRRGAVVDWSPLDPCRPTVKVLDPATANAAEQRISLIENPDITVIETDGVCVKDDNFYPAFEGQFDLTRVGKALTNAAYKPPKPATA
jgi:HD-GYP domain-containing protein (c-di-GMP phosphodiesterase class II)